MISDCAAIPENWVEIERVGNEQAAFTGPAPIGKSGLAEAVADGNDSRAARILRMSHFAFRQHTKKTKNQPQP